MFSLYLLVALVLVTSKCNPTPPHSPDIMFLECSLYPAAYKVFLNFLCKSKRQTHNFYIFKLKGPKPMSTSRKKSFKLKMNLLREKFKKRNEILKTARNDSTYTLLV